MWFFPIFKTISAELFDLLSRWGYGGVFILGILDRITISLIPTEVLLPIYGFLVDSGKFDFWSTFWIVSFGSLIGEVILFWISTRLGREVVQRWGRYFFVSSHDLEHLDQLFAKHGMKIVFWGRFLPVARAIVAIPAGIGGMSLRRFTFYSFLGMLPYNFFLMFLGLKTGENIEFLSQYFVILERIAYAILAGAVAWYIYRHVKKGHATH